MIVHGKFVLVSALLLSASVLSACSDNVAHTRYTCDGGTVIEAAFTNGEYVVVTIDGNSTRINRVEAASGVKYESAADGAVFWSKGTDAMYVARKGVPPLICRRG